MQTKLEKQKSALKRRQANLEELNNLRTNWGEAETREYDNKDLTFDEVNQKYRIAHQQVETLLARVPQTEKRD